MSLEIWQAIPAINEGDLRPIVSTQGDNSLENIVIKDLNLTEADSLFSFINIKTIEFQTGRLVVVNSLKVEAIESRTEAETTEVTDPRWFSVAEFVIRVTAQQSQGCYGGWHKGVALGVFGQ